MKGGNIMKLTEDQKFHIKFVAGYMVIQTIIGYGQYKLIKTMFHIK